MATRKLTYFDVRTCCFLVAKMPASTGHLLAQIVNPFNVLGYWLATVQVETRPRIFAVLDAPQSTDTSVALAGFDWFLASTN